MQIEFLFACWVIFPCFCCHLLFSYDREVPVTRAFFQHFWEKAPGQNWETMIDLTSKLGEINGIEKKMKKDILKIKLF